MLFSEFFGVNDIRGPRLSGYVVNYSANSDGHSLGGKLSFKLQRELGGLWVWVRDDHRLVSDIAAELDDISALVNSLWSDEPETYKDLLGIEPDESYSVSPSALAAYTARRFKSLARDVEHVLSPYGSDLGPIQLKRVYTVRAWNVQGKPAVSISVHSNLIHKDDLSAYHAQNRGVALEGIFVKDKYSDLKGEIVAVTGTVSEHRERLLQLAQKDASQRAISEANDDEPVVAVKTSRGKTIYEYVISALEIVVGTGDFDRFGINGSRALKQMKLAPDKRWSIVQSVASVGQKEDLIGAEYKQDQYPVVFNAFDFAHSRRLLFGQGFVAPYDERSILAHLQQHGLYNLTEEYQVGEPVRIGLIRDSSLDPQRFHDFLTQFKSQMERLNFTPKSTTVETVEDLQRDTIEKAYEKLTGANIILAFFPGKSRMETRERPYTYLKSIAVRNGSATQVVYGETLKNRYAVANVVLGVLAKVGNIPFVLADPLEFADVIVGVDIARKTKTRLTGTINAAATARVYSNSGEFLRYAIQDASLEGETLDEHTLQGLLPYDEFTGKHVIIHRDGYFRGNEKSALREWGERIGAEFYPVEVIKSGAPRLYKQAGNGIILPDKGSAFLINEAEAILVSSPPPFKDGTPKPLQIRSDVLPIEQAIDSVLSLTILHYGSLRAPKLPVTLHYSDKIAGMILDGIKPDRLAGNIPYWL